MTPQESAPLARLDLQECPIGTVLDPAEPDQRIEQQFFAGWTSALAAHPAWGADVSFQVVEERRTGRRVLEHWLKNDRCLLAGEDDWRDYAVEARVRQLLPTSLPDGDDEHRLVGRTGIVFRGRTVRRYYLFCLEAHEGFVLYCRRDDTWTELGRLAQAVDPGRYYDLRVEAEGARLRCFVDGALAVEAQDDAYPSGKAGVRSTTLARVEQITVTSTPAAEAALAEKRQETAAELARARERVPQPVLWRALDVGEPASARFGRVAGISSPVVFLFYPYFWADMVHARGSARSGSCIRAMTLEGETLWQFDSAAEIRRPKLADVDGDGSVEIACQVGEQIALIEGATGKLRAAADLPPAGPFLGRRGERCKPFMLYVAHLRPTPQPSDIVIMDGDSGGGYTVWAYDDRLNLLWTTTVDQPAFGHHLHFADIDGDGCEEVLAGYSLLDHDGSLIRQVEGSEYSERFEYARHPDVVAMGELDGNPTNGPEAVLACGSEGILFVDVASGKVRARHPIGHAQGMSLGNFRPELPGLDVWCGTRWGNYGILTLFSAAGEELYQFQPDYVGQGGPPVNWAGTGEELLFLYSSERALGLWDACGRKLVEMPPEVRQGYYRREPQPLVADVCEDPRDELVFVCGGQLRIYTQDRPFRGERVYAPVRHDRLEVPWISYPRLVP